MVYEIRESTRAKKLTISVHSDGSVVITKPIRFSLSRAEKFIEAHTVWIEQAQEKMKRHQERTEKKFGTAIELPKLRRGTKVYKETCEQAKKMALQLIAEVSEHIPYTYGTISIRNQKTRWGSCSAQGNLSFNYRIIYLPSDVARYLIVHELAHTKHHNHGALFWSAVENHVPNYRELRRQLKRYRF